jgi:hypothetical protein
VVPVFYGDNTLASYAEDLAVEAGVTPAATLLQELRTKAKDLGIPEALDEGALTVESGGTRAGVCTIKIKYIRKVDIYGVYPLTLATDKVIRKPYQDNR